MNIFEEALMWTLLLYWTPMIISYRLAHRDALEKLRAGAPVIVKPDKNDKPCIWQIGAAKMPMVYRPYSGPRRYLGATASPGKMKSWSRGLALLCAASLACKLLLGDQPLFAGLGYLYLLSGIAYMADLPLVESSFRKHVVLFSVAHLPICVALVISSMYDARGLTSGMGYFGILASVSILAFAWLARIPVAHDDIIHEIARWKRNRKRRKGWSVFSR